MATLAACASIFQLAFGVNAVAAGCELYFRNTHRDIARRLFADLRPVGFCGGEESEQIFEKFVLESSPGLRIARHAYAILIASGVIAITLSFVGLVNSATAPDRTLPDWAVWSFSIVTVLVLPTAYWLYNRFLNWFERRYMIEALRSPEERELYWNSFEIVLPLEARRREMKQVLALSEDALIKLYWSNLTLRYRRWARFFTKWWI